MLVFKLQKISGLGEKDKKWKKNKVLGALFLQICTQGGTSAEKGMNYLKQFELLKIRCEHSEN